MTEENAKGTIESEDQPKGREKGWSNIKPAQKGEIRNKRGRGKKAQNEIRWYLEKKGRKVTKDSLKNILGSFLVLSENEIKQMIADSDSPYIAQIIYEVLKKQSKTGQSDLVKWLFESFIGKPKQNIDMEVTEKPAITIQVVETPQHIENAQIVED